MKVAVVIPVYKTVLTETEQVSLDQCLKVLGAYDIIFAAPEGLDPAKKLTPLRTEEFDPQYFKDIKGYNRLMLESHFYERFLQYDYILIYQLDAFVFRDELKEWCAKAYDYIGAPWIATDNFVSRVLKHFASGSRKKRAPIFYKVGNGGFSLRKTRSFYEISRDLKNFISEYQANNQKEIYAIEDVFWSLKVPEFYPDFSIPDYKEAVDFAMDRKPDIALKINNNRLPFGCHGIDKPKVEKFWAPIIQKAYSQNSK